MAQELCDRMPVTEVWGGHHLRSLTNFEGSSASQENTIKHEAGEQDCARNKPAIFFHSLGPIPRTQTHSHSVLSFPALPTPGRACWVTAHMRRRRGGLLRPPCLEQCYTRGPGPFGQLLPSDRGLESFPSNCVSVRVTLLLTLKVHKHSTKLFQQRGNCSCKSIAT